MNLMIPEEVLFGKKNDKIKVLKNTLSHNESSDVLESAVLTVTFDFDD